MEFTDYPSEIVGIDPFEFSEFSYHNEFPSSISKNHYPSASNIRRAYIGQMVIAFAFGSMGPRFHSQMGW